MSAPTRQEMEAQIAQFLEPWAWETTSYNATVARDDAFAKAAQIVEAFPALTSQAAQPAEADGIPADIAEHVRKIGRVEWGQTPAHDAEGHGRHVADSVRMTAVHFGQAEDQHMHGLWLEGTETVLCHTGTSPNAPMTTRALVGAWNWLVDQADLAAIPKAPATDAGEVALPQDKYGETAIDRLKDHAENGVMPPQFREDLTAVLALATPPAPNDDLRAALGEVIDRMGWPEIHAFQDELRKGQDVREDAGGFMLRAIKALFGIKPTDPVTTYQQAARALVDAALKENRRG